MSASGGLRVVQVTPAYPPALGGMERVVEAVAHGLAERGCAVEVLTTTLGAPEAPRRERVGTVEVRRYRTWVVAHTPVALGLLVGLLRQPRGAVVHVHVAQALVSEVVRLACALRGFRYVVHLHLDVDASGPAGRLLPYYKRWFLGPSLRAASRVVTLSPGMAHFVVRSYDVPRERVVVLRNGVDPVFFAGRAARRRVGEGEPLRLLFAGRIAAQKNLPRLLGALSLATAAVELDVVGDGDGRAAAERRAAALGVDGRVRFHGTESSSELAARMRAADVLVLPSDREGMPLVVLEAMASGLPVLATDVAGTRELVRGAGLLVAPDEEGLAAGIDRLAGDRVLRARLAAAGRERARGHAWPEICVELLRELEMVGGR